MMNLRDMARLSMMIGLVIVLNGLALASLHPAHEKAMRAGQVDPSAIISSENAFVKVTCDTDNGKFTIGTADGRRLLFGFPSDIWSTHTQFKVDGTVYSNDEFLDTLVAPLTTTPHLEDSTISCTWTIQGLQIEQRLTPVVAGDSSGTIWIQYVITNPDASAHEVGILLEMDTMVNTNDDAPISTSAGYIDHEHEFHAPNIPVFWQAFEVSPTQPSDRLTAQGTLIGAGAVSPDRFAIGPWPYYNYVVWDYTISGDPYGDSAVLLWWLPVPIVSGGSHQVATFYGLGKGAFSAGELSLYLSAPSALGAVGNDYNPNPFDVNLLVTNTGSIAAEGLTATISLPSGLELSAGDSLTKPIAPDSLDSGQTGNASWSVRALAIADTTTYTFTIAVRSTTPDVDTNSVQWNITVPGLGAPPESLIVIFNQIEVDVFGVPPAFPDIVGYVTVSDQDNQPISGLTEANFQVFEDGTEESPITVTPLGGGGAISVALAMDYSGSMSSQAIDDMEAAADTFVDLMGTEDSAAVIKFASTAVLEQGFTDDANLLHSAINGPFSGAGGTTALYDAIYMGISECINVSGRRAVIVMTDGKNNAGAYSLSQAIDHAVVQGIPIFTVGLGTSIDEDVLRQIASQTGGQYYQAPTSDQLGQLYSLISQTLQNQYQINYTTHNQARDGTQRQVRVRVTYQGLTGEDTRSYMAPDSSRATAILWTEPEVCYLWENLTSDVEVRIREVEDLLGANVILHFDPLQVEAVAVAEGGFLSQNNPTSTQFSSIIDNVAGTVQFNFSLLGGSPQGLTGQGILAILSFRSVGNDSSSLLTFAPVDSLSLRDTVNAAIVPTTAGSRFEVIGAGVGLLGDFDDDNDVDFADYTLFVSYWNVQDSLGDIASTPPPWGAGLPPWTKDNYPYPGDPNNVLIDFEDKMVFALMYNWYKYQGQPVALLPKVALGTPRVKIVAPDAIENGETFQATVSVEEIDDLLGATLQLEYDPRLVQVVDIALEEFMGRNEATVAFGRRDGNGEVSLDMVALGGIPVGVSGSGPLFSITFRALEEGIAELYISDIKLRNSRNATIGAEIKAARITIGDAAEIPQMFALSQNYPNPFNAETNITFDLPQRTELLLEVCNILGEPVRRLAEGCFQAGRHTLRWDGKNDEGMEVSSGIYFFVLQAGNFSASRRMVLMK